MSSGLNELQKRSIKNIEHTLNDVLHLVSKALIENETKKIIEYAKILINTRHEMRTLDCKNDEA